ncbi:MAG: sugar-binding protein, partial [Lachnospiraceae bacterium]|nr:sugar-binding protein [Lachnospiraceae bacterium]
MIKQIWKKLGICTLSLSLVCNSGMGLQSVHAAAEEGSAVETKTGEVLLDGNDIKADNVNGLTYKGFGMLTGNSTSDLLMDYKAENPESYAALMQYLFGGEYPIFTHVKLEMGNDRNNSTGSESATMRTKDEKPNVRRNPGWQLAADAKKVNPDLKVSILSWNTPTWVKTDEDKYYWYKQSILAGYEEFGFMVDYINPNTNEAWGGTKDVTRTKQFAKWIAAEDEQSITDTDALELYHKIKLVVSDEANVVSEAVAETMKSDPEFMEAADVVGYHYKTWDDANDAMKWLAEEQDKEIWNSEEQATFSNSAFRPSNNIADPTVAGTGLGGSGSALEMGNTVIKSFVESRRGHVIYQPVLGSFYEGGQYSFKELVSARDPWSGWIHYDAGLLVLAHISKFAVTGWENEDNTAGIWRGVASASKADAYQEKGSGSNAVNGRNGGENYLTLAAPTKDAFSTVIVNDSEYPMTYTLQTKNMDLPEDQTLELWETRAADDGAFHENYMKCLGDVSKNADGKYQFAVKPYSAVTVTSLDVSDSEEHTQGLPAEGERTVLDTDATGSVQNTEEGYLYADNFEYQNCTMPVLDGQGGLTGETEDYIASRGGDNGAMARYTHTLNGAFEVYKDSTGNYVLRQQSDKETTGVGAAWNRGDPVTLIGDFRWTNYTAAVDVLFERSAEEQYAQIGIRQTGSSHKLESSSGYTFRVGENGEWQLYRRSTSAKPIELATGTFGSDATKPGTWFMLKLRGEGSCIKAYINEELVASYEDEAPITSGRVGLGCSSTNTCFDNLEVTKVKGYAPYYTEYIDNMETYDLTSEKNARLEYNDKWSITCADQGMYVYQRSMSYSTAVGAALTYT